MTQRELYVTEAMTGANRAIPIDMIELIGDYEEIEGASMSAAAEDYGFNRVSSQHPNSLEILFSSGRKEPASCAIYLFDNEESICVLHTAEEVMKAIDEDEPDLHMNAALRRRMIAELERIAPETQSLHVVKGFGSPVVRLFSTTTNGLQAFSSVGIETGLIDESMHTLETVERSWSDVYADLKAGKMIDGTKPITSLQDLLTEVPPLGGNSSPTR